MFNGHFVFAGPAIFKPADVFPSRVSDVLERFVSEERLMAGDEDIGEGQQSGERVISDDLVR